MPHKLLLACSGNQNTLPTSENGSGFLSCTHCGYSCTSFTLSGTIWTSLGLFSWFQDICVNFQHFQEECKQEAESASPLLTVFRYLISPLFTAFHFISSALHSFTLLCWFFDRRRMTKWERLRSKQQKGHKNLMRSERKWSLVMKWKPHFLLAWSLH